jgi:hypothetical protein
MESSKFKYRILEIAPSQFVLQAKLLADYLKDKNSEEGYFSVSFNLDTVDEAYNLYLKQAQQDAFVRKVVKE